MYGKDISTRDSTMQSSSSTSVPAMTPTSSASFIALLVPWDIAFNCSLFTDLSSLSAPCLIDFNLLLPSLNTVGTQSMWLGSLEGLPSTKCSPHMHAVIQFRLPILSQNGSYPSFFWLYSRERYKNRCPKLY